ncbi:hypothetical protein [Rhodopirellula europaea]|uniref:hypothetical protein n=1 Tax=Rhodopirellula europaea TaxID=1263866 RepID=UPI003D2CA584|tara:strand:+ start:16122 stop:16958 length:837 start_codon:yes stop_codon:yes gene_type:complete
MKNPIDLILANSPHNEVLLAASQLDGLSWTHPADSFDQSKITTIRNYVSQVCRTTGLQSTLITGALLGIFAAVAREEENPDAYNELLEEIGISRTQGYRCRIAWNRFGKVLIAEPNIRNEFVAEAIKLLSSPNVCDDAVEQALDLARAGTRISIKMATSIIEMHHGDSENLNPLKETVFDDKSTAKPDAFENDRGTDESIHDIPPKVIEPPSSNSLPQKVIRSRWNYPGRCIEVILEPIMAADELNVDDMIDDLLDAFQKFKEEITRQTSEQQESISV